MQHKINCRESTEVTSQKLGARANLERGKPFPNLTSFILSDVTYRLLQELDETLGHGGTHTSNDISSPPYGVLSTAQHVMDEELQYRMIAETRRVLVKQLAEAELVEVKENNKVRVYLYTYVHTLVHM